MKKLFTLAALLSWSVAQAAEGFTTSLNVTSIEIGRNGTEAVVYVDAPLAECSGTVFRLYVGQFGLTAEGFKYNYAQLLAAKIGQRPVVIYHSGGAYCWVANVRLN